MEKIALTVLLVLTASSAQALSLGQLDGSRGGTAALPPVGAHVKVMARTEAAGSDDVDLVEKALGPNGQAPASVPKSVPSTTPAPVTQPLATTPAPQTPPAPPPATTTTSGGTDRTGSNPWNGLQNTGPVPTHTDPAPCAMPGDPWGAGAPKCPAGYVPGQSPLQCGGFATMVNLAGSVVCVSNSIGMDQMTGGAISPADRTQAQSYLQARGLPASAAMFAANALNAPNLKGYVCSQNKFTNTAPMSTYTTIEWNLILFDYIYGGVNNQQISQPLPALCNS